MKYIAIIAPDRSGPAYGTGNTEDEARADAAQWGFNREDGIAVEITAESFQRIRGGNPDAVEFAN